MKIHKWNKLNKYNEFEPNVFKLENSLKTIGFTDQIHYIYKFRFF